MRSILLRNGILYDLEEDAYKKSDLKARSYGSIAELVEEGVKTALITDHPYNSIDCLRIIANIALVQGLTFKDVIKLITVNAAEILNCQDRIGKLEVTTVVKNCDKV